MVNSDRDEIGGKINIKRDFPMVMHTPTDSTRNYSEELDPVQKMRN